MRSSDAGPRVVSLPHQDRADRELLLKIAASALPVLQAALAMGNATTVQRVVNALCALPDYEAALVHLDAIHPQSAEVIPLLPRNVGARSR